MNNFFKRLSKYAIAVLLLPILLSAQSVRTPLEECSFKSATSHEALVTYLGKLENISPQIKIESIGISVQGREIPMVHVLKKDSGHMIKVLVFCQQHGNEPSGKEAALLLLEKLASPEGNKMFSNLDLFIVPSVNPDGNEAAKRANANGADLNRNHLILTQPEVIALHKIFNRVQPQVTLDVHEYSAFRKEFRDVGYFRTADEQFGAPTNLNVSPAIIDYALNGLFPYLDSELKKKGVIFSDYYKMNGPDDTVRTSTTSIDDGRQSFAILNTFSFILEGKNGRNMNDELERRALRQLAAIESFLSFADNNSDEIKNLVASEKTKIVSSGNHVAVKMDYVYEGKKISLPMQTITGKDTLVEMNFSPEVKLLESVDRPKAYVIPGDKTEIIEFLDKHNIVYKKLNKPEELTVEIYSVDKAETGWMENKTSDFVYTTKRKEKVELKPGDAIVPLNNVHAFMLVTAFEPSSMWGLVQYDEFQCLRTVGKDYPIFRIPIQ